MPVQWTVENHNTRGAKRPITIKRVVDRNESTAQTFSDSFPIKATKVQIRARFKQLFLDEEDKRTTLDQKFKTSDLVNFETEVRA